MDVIWIKRKLYGWISEKYKMGTEYIFIIFIFNINIKNITSYRL